MQLREYARVIHPRVAGEAVASLEAMRRALVLVISLVVSLGVSLLGGACGAAIGSEPSAVAGDDSGGAVDAGSTGSGGGGGGGGGAQDGGPPPGTEPDAAAPASIDAPTFLAGYVGGFCTEAFACQASFPASSQTGSFSDNFGSSIAQCTTGSEAALGASHVPGDITNGKITYDGAAAAACLAGIDYGTCANFWATGGSYPAACGGAVVGSVATGGACNSAFECAAATDYCPNQVCVAP